MGAGAIIMGAGAGMQAVGQLREGMSAENAANFNAHQAEINARRAKEKSLEDEKRFRISVRKEAGANRTAVASSGIKLEGSPLAVLRENSRNAEQDAIAIRMGGDLARDTFLADARFSRAQGRSARRAARLGSAATLLTTGGDIADRRA